MAYCLSFWWTMKNVLTKYNELWNCKVPFEWCIPIFLLILNKVFSTSMGVSPSRSLLTLLFHPSLVEKAAICWKWIFWDAVLFKTSWLIGPWFFTHRIYIAVCKRDPTLAPGLLAVKFVFRQNESRASMIPIRVKLSYRKC